MNVHKFKAGHVTQVTSKPQHPLPSGRYEVLRGMPERESELQYRVKSLTDGSEWVVKESALT